ncbi:hypothetical protein FKP32DRAFT_1558348 [Trametes sanguinea]|nr:hypothetical protein FKP32DRAFT_1558348 [Trametes sanguinea]
MDIELADSIAPKYPSSKATRQRRRKKRRLKGGKAGNPGVFHSSRDAFFAEHLPAFIALKGASRKSQDAFWRKIFEEYWIKWPWYVPIDKHTEEEVWPQPDTTVEAVREAKGNVIKQTQNRIRARMRYQRTVFNAKHRNPWAPMLDGLEERAAPLPAPRKLAVWQLYMAKEPEKIAEIFDSKWPSAGLPDNHSLTFRAQIARELLDQESDEFRRMLEEELNDLHAVEAAEQKEAANANRIIPEEDREAAQDSAAAVIQPLLELLREQTGYYITLIAGIPLITGEKEFKVKIITAGKTADPKPVPWHGVDPDRFKSDVIMSFTRFLMKTPEWAAREAQANGGTSAMVGSHGVASSSPPQGLASSSPPLTESPPTAIESTPVGLPKSTKGQRPRRNRKGKQKRRGRPGSDTEPDASETDESSDDGETSAPDDHSSSDENGEDGEDEDGDADEDADVDVDVPVDGDDDADADADEEEERGAKQRYLYPVPRGATVPDADAIGLGPAIQGELARLSAFERRSHLYRFSRMTEFERECINGRAQAAALLNIIQPTPIPLYMSTAVDHPAPKKPRSKKVRAAASTHAPRKSQRLLAGRGADIRPTAPTSSSTSPERALATATPAQNATAAPTTSDTVSMSATAAATTSTSATAVPLISSAAAVSAISTASSSSPMAAAPATSPAAIAASTLGAPASAPTTAASSSSLASADTSSPTTAAAEPTTGDPRSGSGAPLSAGGSMLPDEEPVIFLDEDDWPSWMREAFDHMESQRLGPDFMKALEWWTVLERVYGFETSAKGLGTVHRPPEVHHWLRVQRRVLGKAPSIDDEQAAGRPIIGGQGDWDALVQPGRNGILIVLLSLVWWRAAATSSTLDDWHAAVQDVRWVVVSMARSALKDRDKK